MPENNFYSRLLGRKVKAVYVDDGNYKVVYGVLNEVHSNSLVIDEVMIGIGPHLISCKPVEEQ